jgi:hypothetical protein
MGNGTRLIGTLTAVFTVCLFAASSASATYEQVDTFAGTPGSLKKSGEEWPEEVQLGNLGGMAVNYTGAGGVPAGTVYAVDSPGVATPLWVTRFNPDTSFSEAWTFEGDPPEVRCGPEGEPAHPNCPTSPGNGGRSNADVEVDQATGNVYVLNAVSNLAGRKMIRVYTPDGSKLIAQFGEEADWELKETIAESPQKIHATRAGGIAVDAAGKVYVQDSSGAVNRLMAFEPQSSGDYEHYVYAGQGKDVTIGTGRYGPVIDAAGHIYMRSEFAVTEYDPSQPSAPPICEFEFPKGGIESLTVNPKGGEVFFATYKDKKIHQLSPCEEGKFTEVGSFGPVPKRNYIGAMAVDPNRQFEPSRPAGILYAGSPGGEGGKTEGEFPDPVFVESALGYVFAPPVAVPPAVESQSASGISSSGAALGAQINPKGAMTRYRFQYITEAAYQANEPADRFAGAAEAPPGGALLGEGNKPLSAVGYLSGLLPDTTYRFRAIAASFCDSEHPEEPCEDTGSDQAFHTFPAQAPGLPDKRAWELVSPVDKHGGSVFPADPSIKSCVIECTVKPGSAALHFPMQSSPDGEAIVYEGTPFSGSEGVVNQNSYLAHRDAKAGWHTTILSQSEMGISGGAQGYRGFNTDLTQGLFNQIDPTIGPDAPPGYPNLYTQPTTNPLQMTPLLTEAPPNRPPNETFNINYAGASADFSRIFFSANDALTPETPFAPEALDGGAGKANLYEWSEGHLALVNVLPGNTTTIPGAAFGAGNAHSISTDGSRVFWEDEAHQVYLREGAQITKAISTEGSPDPGAFLAASPDGSEALLANGHLHGLGGEEATTDLTGGQGGFQGLVGHSEDLSRIYFVDTAVLTGEEESDQGAKAQAGKNNLYAFQQESGTRFIATLPAGDNNAWNASASKRTAEASPGGRWLAFLSAAPLTGYENTGPCKIIASGPPTVYGPAPCTEAFLYDSATGELVCASCNPTLVSPRGSATLRLIQNADSSIPQPRYLSDSGRLFFDSQDSLSVFDTNEGVEDVYQYEPQGVGTCGREAGCIDLISAGTGPLDSNFLAADASGKNVFFTTRDQLSGLDHDDLIDLYDAREEGGIPAESEPARAECQGEACQPLVSAPNDPTPATSLVEGAGNVNEEAAKCAKGKARKRGRCVKHQAKKHHKQKRSRAAKKTGRASR